jgi:hypothetical protein
MSLRAALADVDMECVATGPEEIWRRRPKTKIVCTLGPASRSVEMCARLLRAGMCVARFNFSHGSHEYHQETLDNLRKAMDLTGLICAVMLDTKVHPSTRFMCFPAFARRRLSRQPFFLKKVVLADLGFRCRLLIRSCTLFPYVDLRLCFEFHA